jgi:tetratricopeptide (TPR) repeat protein
LDTYRRLAQLSPESYLPDVAMTLNNLGILQAKQHDFGGAKESYREALDTYRRLAQLSPEAYLPAVAATLNNLGALQAKQHDFAGAEKAYREALDTYRRLAQVNPEAYLPDVAMTAVNMSIFFLQSQPDREKSLAYAKEAVQAAQPFMEIIPATKADADKALQVAEAWELEPAVFWKEAIKSLKKY